MWLSTLGSAIAYGLSAWAATMGLSVLVAGRLIGGIFGQTLALVMAYLADLYKPDMLRLKVQNTRLWAVNAGAPVLLAPIGGILGEISLNMPFFVSAGFALAGLCFALYSLKDVSEIKAASAAVTAPALTADAAATKLQAVQRSHTVRSMMVHRAPARGSPWTDPTLLLLAASYCAFGLAMQATYFALPKMLMVEPSFGQRSGQDVARTIGLTQIPYGVAQVLMQQVGYLRLAERGVSEAACIASSGLVMAACTMAFFLASGLAAVYTLYLVQGAAIGLLLAAFLNLPNLYIVTFYPHSIAQARGVPFPFFNLGMMAGPLVVPLLGPRYHRTGWLAAGGVQLLAVAILLAASARVKKATARTAEELAPLLRTAAHRAATAAGVVDQIQRSALSKQPSLHQLA